MLSAPLSFAALAALMTFGFVLLAMSQDKHRRAAGAKPIAPRDRRLRRLAGYSAQLLALALAIWRDGPGFGSMIWLILLTLTALGVTLVLSWKPAWLTRDSRATW